MESKVMTELRVAKEKASMQMWEERNLPEHEKQKIRDQMNTRIEKQTGRPPNIIFTTPQTTKKHHAL